MRTTIAMLLGATLLSPLAGCKSEPKVEASPEMKAFIGGFGSSAKVKAQLQTYAPGVDAHDMDMYDLKDPAITGTESKGGQTCYTFDAKAGMTTRTYGVCWEGAKIKSVEDKGMK